MKNKWFMLPAALLAVFGLLTGCNNGNGPDKKQIPTKDWVVPASQITLVSCGGNASDGTADGNKYTLVSTADNSTSVGFYWAFPTAENADGFTAADYENVKVSMKILEINASNGVAYIAKADSSLGPDAGGGMTVVGAANASSSGEFPVAGFSGMLAFQYNPWSGTLDAAKTTPDHTVEVSITFLAKKAASGSGDDFAPLTVNIADNFRYGAGYQNGTDSSPSPDTRWNKLLNTAIAVGDVYEFDMVFIVSRDLEEPLALMLVDLSPAANYWIKLGDNQPVGPGTTAGVNGTDPSDGPYTSNWDGDVLEAGVTHSFKVEITVTRAGAAADCGVYFNTRGTGNKGTLGTGVEGPFDMVFEKFVITKK